MTLQCRHGAGGTTLWDVTGCWVFCTWRRHSEQHSCGLHSCVSAEGAAVETPVLWLHTCKLQTDIQAVGTAHPASVAVVFIHQTPFYLLTHPDDTPGQTLWHLFQNDLVDGAIVDVVTADGHVVVLPCDQLPVCFDPFRGGGLCEVLLFWRNICRKENQSMSRKLLVNEVLFPAFILFGYLSYSRLLKPSPHSAPWKINYLNPPPECSSSRGLVGKSEQSSDKVQCPGESRSSWIYFHPSEWSSETLSSLGSGEESWRQTQDGKPLLDPCLVL